MSGSLRSQFSRCFLFMLFFVPYHLHAGEPRWFLTLLGGTGWMRFGDINDALNVINQYYTDKAVAMQVQPQAFRSRLEAFHAGMGADLEIRYSFNGRLALGFGAGYLRAAGNGNQLWIFENDQTFDETCDHSVSALPVAVHLHYGIPLWSRFRMNASCGPVWCPVRLTDRRTLKNTFSYSGMFNITEFSAEGSGIGLQSAAGLEFRLSRSLSLVFEISARTLTASHFKGSGSSDNPWYDLTSYLPDGRLFAFQRLHHVAGSDDTGNWYQEIELLEEAPVDPEYFRNVRDAEVDLSGYGFRIGLSVGLF